MPLVPFRQYRDYDAQRVLVNDSVMGLLAGSKLATQTLRLAEGSELHLADIFPQVPHVKRFNLKVDRAAEVLQDAENHLAAICIPYLFAVHEAFIKHCVLRICNDSSLLSNTKFKNASMETMHETIEGLHPENAAFAEGTLALFHVLRAMRNTIVHNNSMLTEPRHLNAIQAAPDAAKTLWTRLTKDDYPAYQNNDSLNPNLSMLIATLAVTKRLAEEANHLLQGVLTRSDWERIADEDWTINGKPSGNQAQTEKQHRGFIRHYYSAVLDTKPGL